MTICIFIILAGICLLFEILGWIFKGQSFLLNPNRLKLMILQMAVIGIGLGGLCSLTNGFLIAKTGISPFIATFGMLPVFIYLVMAILAHILLTQIKYGKYVYAIGGNQHADVVSGINAANTKLDIGGLGTIGGTIIFTVVLDIMRNKSKSK